VGGSKNRPQTESAINRSLSLRIIGVDDPVSTFDYGADYHQNNIRLGAGLVLRF